MDITNEIDESWNLKDIYNDKESIEYDFSKLENLVNEIKKYRNNITDAETLNNYCLLRENFQYIYRKLYIYAMLQVDLDTRKSTSHSLFDRVKQIGYKFNKKDYFFVPFLMSLEKSTLEKYIEEKSELNYFQSELLGIHRYRDHSLSQDQELILSKFQESLESSQKLFSIFHNTDIQFGFIKNDNGEYIQLTRLLYSKYIRSIEQDKRKEAYKAYNKPYMELKNTIALNLATSIKDNVLISKLRRYPSTIEQFLFTDQIPIEIYNNLIEFTKANNEPFIKYLRLRKKILNIDKLNAFDLNVPLVNGNELNEIPFNNAFNLLKAALNPLGFEYFDVFKTFKSQRYIDVKETPGKRPGAYSIGLNDVHPFILLNYRNDINSLITFAHESGHAMHSYFSSKYQPAISSSYSDFVAEVASTVNEILLLRHLLNTVKSKREKAYILNSFIDRFIVVFINQVMLAEFEKEVYNLAESNISLDAKTFNLTYEKIFENYYGDEVIIDDDVKNGWSRIPHFYRPFYVYKYATGYAVAIDVAERILANDNKTIDSYLNFLKSGKSLPSLELLKDIDVDLSKEKTIKKALNFFDEIINEFSLAIAPE